MSWKSRFPRTPIDDAIARQREIVLRLPRWLVGSMLAGTLALGIYWAATRTGLWRIVTAIIDDDVLATLATATLPLYPVLIGLYIVARLRGPRPPPSVPPARVV